MKSFLNFLSQIKSYKPAVAAYIICYILTAVFTVVSIPAIIPLFEMLFANNIKPTEAVTTVNSVSDFFQFIKYNFSEWMGSHERSTAIFYVCLGVAGIFFLKNLFRYLAIYFISPVKAGIVRDTRKKLFNKLMNLPLSYFSNERKGDLIARMTNDVNELESTLLSSIEAWVKDPLIILGSILFMLYASPELTLFVLFLLFITSFVIGGISRSLKRNAMLANNDFGELIAIQEESLGGIRIIKAFGAEEYIKSRFNKILDKYRKLVIKINRRRELAPPLSEFLGITVVCILMWYGARLVFQNQIDGATFLAFLYAFFNVIEPSKALSASYFNIQKGMAALERIQQVINTEEQIVDDPSAIEKHGFNQSIEFSNVHFTYPGSNHKVLQNINIVIKKGETVAIVGSSGSGKTTFVDLLSRFYDVDEGQILIDGTDIRKIKLKSLRTLMGMVTQEPILFNDSIRNNIEFGGNASKEQALWEVLTLANAKDFVQDQPKALEYEIGDRGMKLSGGQRQRLTLARAILRNPPILILDEATSSLDSASEKLVQEAMAHVLEDRTAIVIAHRLSTIQHADKIIVLKDGLIVEQGNHTKLLSNRGEYSNFVELQTFS
ncbi:MAG: ABC transporter ATP-binding protein/permease [Bacteroidota bacterium]|nr:ABC transporter ATP-binding protein/permease [Bacteroidota bacterium]